MRIEQVSIQNWHFLERLFTSSVECSECWCMNHRSDPTNCPTGKSAKEALREEIASGKVFGLLAIVDNSPAGWCAIDPARTQIGHDYVLQADHPISSNAWMIHCLYVEENFRGKGISKALIEGALTLARNNGASEVLAFPIPEESKGKFPKNIAEFSGRFSTFTKLGFKSNGKFSDFYETMSLKLEST